MLKRGGRGLVYSIRFRGKHVLLLLEGYYTIKFHMIIERCLLLQGML
jgi:hypothetical protein